MTLRGRERIHHGASSLCLCLLAQLNGNATSNSYVRTISIERSEVPGGTVCSTVGWGDETPAAALHKATVTIIKQRDCLSNYPGLADNLICGHSGSAEVTEKVAVA